ncbi:DUF885 family protein [uncultured Sphingomonas sp.]|uniref:DUF885 domain-containing protein n=1 Tax=uncultured Sphingomonas sp. TaxID=158754 RepID=UPI0035CB9DDB
MTKGLTMHTDRRQFLAGTAATAALAAAPLRAQIGATPASPLKPLFDGLVQAQLRRSPEGATQLGLDTGANADLRAKLSDQSATARAAAKAQTLAQLGQLEAIDRRALSADEQVDLDSVLYTLRSAAAVQRFDFGGSSYGPSPYVVSQQSGAYQSIPDFLDTKHPLNTKADADAYLARLRAFATQLDDNSERMRHDVGVGVVPPDFILDLTIAQMEKTALPAEQALVVQSLARRAAAKGLGDDYGRQAAAIYTAAVLPALQRQFAYVRAVRRTAKHDAGVWALPQGAAFYPVALRATTTSALSPEEVHRFGLDQAASIGARLDAEMKRQGYTKGTIGERLVALAATPGQLYPNTDAGKAEAIAYCNSRLDAIRGRLPTVFERLPSYKFEVRRVPPQTEAGAAAAFSQSPAIDGSRPGIVYFNLRDARDWPRYDLSTTVFHEGLPGHQLEGGLALSNTRLPLIRKIGSNFSGYAEGWALYAEQLADELGMYADDPAGRIGYLAAQLFRANRCIVDTGLHHYRWTRERAVQQFRDAVGYTESRAGGEVDRYCVNPGQACSYKLGHSTFVAVRDHAKAKLGPRFDLKAYHTAVLRYGRLPLEVLQRVGDAWVASA